MKNTIIKVLSVVMAMVFAFGSCLVVVSATDAADCDHANATVYGQVDATCEAWGYTLYECPDCDTYFTKDNVNELIPPHCLSDGFAWVDVDTVAATCVAKGYETKTCPVCDTVITKETDDIDPDAHVWGEWEVTEQQTCTGEGVKARTCTLCEEVETADVDADGHEWIADEDDVVAPTCQEEGYMPYHCANCDATREVVIKVCDCVFVEMEEVEASCGVQGHTAGLFCKWCLTPGNESSKLYDKVEHVWEKIPGTESVDATCETEGYFEGKCKNCQVEQTVIVPATGHEFGATWTYKVDPTCTTWGYKLYGCIYCGEVFINDSHEPLGHNYVATGNDVDADCENAGGLEFKCDRTWEDATGAIVECGDVIIEADPTRPALGHETVEVEGKAATCLEAGWTEGVECTREGCDYTTVEEISALGHTKKNLVCTTNGVMDVICATCDTLLEEGVAVQVADNATETHVWNVTVLSEPVCGKAGQNQLTCKYCNKVSLQVVPALVHVTEVTEVAATCMEEGYYLEVCTLCDEVIDQETYAIDPDAHVGIINTEASSDPTCDKDGKEIGDCTLCHKPYTKVLPKTGHNYETVEGFDATCDATGLTDGSKCTKCDKWAVEQKEIPVLGHNMVTEEGKAPTCTESGYTATKYCDREGCGYVEIAKVVLSALNHDGYSEDHWQEHGATCANGGTFGYNYHGCPYCDDAYIDEFEYAPAHVWGDDIVVPVTCTTDGYTTAICENCGEYREYSDIVEAEGHKDDEGNVIPTACNRGEIEDIHCVVCDKDIEPQCDWKFVDYIPATCLTYRHDIYVCGVCGEEKLEIVYGLGGHDYEVTKDPANTAPTFEKAITVTNECTLCGDTIVTYETAGVQFTTEVVNGTGADVFVNGSKELKVEIYMIGDHTKFNTAYVQYKFNSNALTFVSAKANGEIIHNGEFDSNTNNDVITMSFCESNDTDGLGSLELTGENVLFATLTFKVKDSYIGLGQVGPKSTQIGNIEDATLLAIDANNNAIYSEVGNTTEVQDVYLRGDITEDGMINSHDLVAMRALIANNSTTAIGDISLDGNVNQADFILLRNWVIGKMTYPNVNP